MIISNNSINNSTKLIKRRNLFKNYIIILFIIVILVICCQIILIGDYSFATRIVKILHEKNKEWRWKNDDITITTTLNSENLINSDIFAKNLNATTIKSDSSTDIFRNKRDVKYKNALNCINRDYNLQVLQHGDYWILKNYVRAGHGIIKCHETVTYTTHAHYMLLNQLILLLENWRAPISLALHAPKIDFSATINSISYLRNCLPESPSVRQFVTFHIYFDTKNMPINLTKSNNIDKHDCNMPSPFLNFNQKDYKSVKYPVNVGRNIARDAAQTHFILDSDIDLYPSKHIPQSFIEMLVNNITILLDKTPKIFILPVFKISETINYYPDSKNEIQILVNRQKASSFSERTCLNCNETLIDKWLDEPESNELDIRRLQLFHDTYSKWQPIYIGTHADPHYDERLSWEGYTEKIIQSYLLCVLNYEFFTLNNVFLSYKTSKNDTIRYDKSVQIEAFQYVNNTIYPELQILYGSRRGCKLF